MLHVAPRAFLACLLLAVSTIVSAQEAERLRIHGSNTMGAQLVPALVESWLRDTGYEGIRRQAHGPSMLEIHAVRDGAPLVVEIGKRGSASGFSDLIEGEAELAMSVRPPDAREIDAAWQLGDLGTADQEYVVAVDGIVAVVHASNPVRHLDVAQLRAIHEGRIRNWAQLGGPDRPIRVLSGRTHSASGELFRDAVMRGAAMAAAVQSHPRVAAGVAADPGAIGIVPLRSRVPAGVRPLAIADGGLPVYPTRLGVLSEDYPLLRRYSLYGGQMMSALGRSFALYTMTARAQRSIGRAGHFAVMLRPVPQSRLSAARTDYRELVAGAQRLPLSLRFDPDGTQSVFDSRAVRDLDRLAALMRQPAFRQHRAVVVAFGHPDRGGGIVSTLVANDRADLVAGYLVGQGLAVGRAHGFGASQPLAAPESPGARYRNERVEIWLL